MEIDKKELTRLQNKVKNLLKKPQPIQRSNFYQNLLNSLNLKMVVQLLKTLKNTLIKQLILKKNKNHLLILQMSLIKLLN